MTKILQFFLVTLAIFIFASCSEDDDPNAKAAPAIPPASTMMMEFETFSQANGRTESFQNAIRAGNHIAAWKNLMTVDMAIPVTAFLTSADKKPKFSDGVWTWQYEFTASDTIYNADLHATEATDSTLWEMHVSQPDGFSDLLSFEGWSSSDGTTGEWMLYNPDDTENAALYINWKMASKDEIDSMKYIHKSGSSISYKISSEGPFDGSYAISNNGNDVNIHWSREKKNGQIIEPVFYQDSLPHCWNTNFEDIECE